MAKKMPKKLVALGASAIAAVYVAGYFETRDADSRLAATVQTALNLPTTQVPGTILDYSQYSHRVAQSTSAGALPNQMDNAASYRNGTYYGFGMSPRGTVAVSIDIQGGRITNVTITRARTPYPVALISALPGQVVSRQSAQIDRISGATYSTMAFQAAVQEALDEAQTS